MSRLMVNATHEIAHVGGCVDPQALHFYFTYICILNVHDV